MSFGTEPLHEKIINLEKKLKAVADWHYGMLLKMPFIGSEGHISKWDLDRLRDVFHPLEEKANG